MKTGFVLVMIAFVMTQCSKDTSTAPEVSIDPYDEVLSLNDEITALDEQCLTDTTNIEKRLEIALLRLERLLNHVGHMVGKSGNLSADSLYQQALEAQAHAIAAKDTQNFQLAFDYVKESAYLAFEAAKIIRQEIIEKIKDLIAHIREDIEITREIREEVRILLDQTQNPPPLALNLFRRSTYHFGMTFIALDNKKPRKAHFHIHRSRRLAIGAKIILEAVNSP
jgi:hypothetical protein